MSVPAGDRRYAARGRRGKSRAWRRPIPAPEPGRPARAAHAGAPDHPGRHPLADLALFPDVQQYRQRHGPVGRDRHRRDRPDLRHPGGGDRPFGRLAGGRHRNRPRPLLRLHQHAAGDARLPRLRRLPGPRQRHHHHPGTGGALHRHARHALGRAQPRLHPERRQLDLLDTARPRAARQHPPSASSR